MSTVTSTTTGVGFEFSDTIAGYVSSVDADKNGCKLTTSDGREFGIRLTAATYAELTRNLDESFIDCTGVMRDMLQPGVVYEDVDTAVLAHGELDEHPAVVAGRHVGPMELPTDARGERAAFGLVEIRDDHVRAVRREVRGDRSSDAARSAGHDSCLADECAHERATIRRDGSDRLAAAAPPRAELGRAG